MDGTRMTAFRHAPYAGASRPFSIGLTPLDPARWIEPDAAIDRYLCEKQALSASHRDDVFRMAQDSLEAQREGLAMLMTHLADHPAALWRRDGAWLAVAGHRVDLSDETLPPLLRAGLLVQDDLVIMVKRPAGWCLAAAHLCFPSSWRLAEKFDRPMEEVHAHVPGFEGGTRNGQLINRIFDNLAPDHPVERFNWSINWQDRLFHPEPGRQDGADPAQALVRVERQTLRKLPQTRAIVFTIRIYLDPVRLLPAHPRGRALARGLAEQLEGLSPAQVAYKGLDRQRDRLAAWLRAAASP